MTKQELLKKRFHYIATLQPHQKVELWVKFAGTFDQLQYIQYLPEYDDTELESKIVSFREFARMLYDYGLLDLDTLWETPLEKANDYEEPKYTDTDMERIVRREINYYKDRLIVRFHDMMEHPGCPTQKGVKVLEEQDIYRIIGSTD